MFSDTPRHVYSRRIGNEKLGREPKTLEMYDAPVQRKKWVEVDQDPYHIPMYPSGSRYQPKFSLPGTGPGNKQPRADDIDVLRQNEDHFFASYMQEHPGQLYGPLWRPIESFVNAYRQPSGRRSEFADQSEWYNALQENRMTTFPVEARPLPLSQHGQVGQYQHDNDVAWSGERQPHFEKSTGDSFAPVTHRGTNGHVSAATQNSRLQTLQQVLALPRKITAESTFVPVKSTGITPTHKTVGDRITTRRVDTHERVHSAHAHRPGVQTTTAAHMNHIPLPAQHADTHHLKASSHVDTEHLTQPMHKAARPDQHAWMAPDSLTGRVDVERKPTLQSNFLQMRASLYQPDQHVLKASDHVERVAGGLQVVSHPNAIQSANIVSEIGDTGPEKFPGLDGLPSGRRITAYPMRQEVDATHLEDLRAPVDQNTCLQTIPDLRMRPKSQDMVASSRSDQPHFYAPSATSH